MVSKKCAGCGSYFSGELNGNYLCPVCASLGSPELRPLSGLDALDETWFGEEPRYGATPDESERGRNVKGQAA